MYNPPKKSQLYALFLLISICCTLLPSCISLRPDPLTKHQKQYKKIDHKKRIERLEKIQTWDINGSFSAQFPNPNSPQNRTKTYMAKYEWQQDANSKNFEIKIDSSLNIENIVIKSSKVGVTLIVNNQKKPGKYTSPEDLTKKTLGFKLPVSDLYYWIRGLPTKNASDLQYDKNYGHLIGLKQGEWDIKLSHFEHTTEADIPLVLDITNTTEKLKLKIVTKKNNWVKPN